MSSLNSSGPVERAGTDYDGEVMSVQVECGLGQEVKNVQFDWNATNATNFTIELQLHFNQSFSISSVDGYDSLIVKFKNDTYFKDLFGDVLERFLEDRESIPPQIPEDDVATKALAGAAGAIQTATKAVTAGSVIFSLFFSLSLNILWGMVHTLQYIVHLPILNVRYPGNIGLLQSDFMSIAQFDLIETQGFYEGLFKIEKGDPFTS